MKTFLLSSFLIFTASTFAQNIDAEKRPESPQTEPRRASLSTDRQNMADMHKATFRTSPEKMQAAMGDNLKVEVYTLPNGLTVYLNEDHTLPSVYGGVGVNAGGKYDPADNTGMGHYLEHMLFKGTTTIGTKDFAKEKPYLDRITRLYDSLGKTVDDAQRKSIQQKINDVAVQAAEFAVPNDLDKMLKSFGSTGVNAFTSFELIFYHNTFPATEIEKWLTIYSDRFENPVFRLFQSELEVVYEEKNKGSDNMGNAIFETFLASFFPKHPYGQSVIGKTEHLKNPSLSKMYEYFEKYYVPNNMALVLCGDFDREKIKPLIQEKFGKWQKKEVALPSFAKEAPFKGREVVSKRLSPVKVGLMGFRTVENGNKDEYGLEVVTHLLGNENQTGLLDKLTTDRKLMMVQTFPLQLNDDGGYVVIFVPKIIGQSLKKAESLVWAELNKVKNGEFTEGQLAAAKQQLKMAFYSQLEKNESRGRLIADIFTQKRSWEDYLQYPQKIDALTKADIMKIASTYFGENVLVLNSKMGFPKKDKLDKPGFKPVAPKEEAVSNYAQRFKQLPSQTLKSPYVDFQKDINFSPKIGEGLYYTQNPINEICSFSIHFPKGVLQNPRYEKAGSYFNEVGASTFPFQKFNAMMDSLGFTVSCSVGEDKTIIEMKGIERNFPQAWKWVSEKIKSPEVDAEKIKMLVDEAKFEPRLFQREKEQVGMALRDFAMFGKQSAYLNRLTLAEIKSLKPEQLIADWKAITAHAPTYHYVGRMPVQEIEKQISSTMDYPQTLAKPQEKPMKTYAENTILILDDKKSRQSHIWFYIQGSSYKVAEEYRLDAFNSYFGGDMSSLMFQEIREFRSLAYSTGGTYRKYKTKSDNGYFSGYIGCQGDKTTESVQTLYGMLSKLPQKPERIDDIRSGLLAKIPSNKPNFRDLSKKIAEWKEFGYFEDPSKQKAAGYPNLRFDDITQFHQNNIANKPIVITIVGDKSKFNLTELAKLGKVQIVKLTDIYRK